MEEATKATVLFAIAIALRYRVVSKLQAVTLAGLSAAGFAFTENILYYSRAIVYSSVTIGTGNPEDALHQIVFLRGVKTAFGHPLFTTLLALGFIIGLRAQSKIVRILAPLGGYLAASLGHMMFNFFASVGMDDTLMAIIGWVIALSIAIHLVRTVLAQGRLLRDRLDDYVSMGWLPASVVPLFARQRTRWASFFISITYGWRAMVATLRIQRTMSELAYLRDAQLLGTVDDGGDVRARALLDRARDLAPIAITDPATQKVQLPKLPAWFRRRKRRAEAVGPWGPPGSGQIPASFLPGQVGSPGYSPVDPRWGPPRG
ncbi:PrsW family intramembrane metalloprotease [Propioniciclava coleopterorum]|uniref:PrsW family intramembrane metalloprotease n=1 Tax=Propioniciclava coleopterorum TaxID=2714937 RepID=A0A6G7Y3C0_9ACTN|nr:PrsW family glutamic-type intramembrane protease [Propioniciclava coleopterorum]QIK71199.1 PrsW family intramembrane metalloprotease [Propioniciclava coleopterorum]